MRRKWKIGLSLLLAASMVPSTVPVKATTLAVNVEKNVYTESTTVEKKEAAVKKKVGKAEYKKGEAIIMYDSGKSSTVKSMANTLGGDIQIKETYEFGKTNSSLKLNSASVQDSISVSLVTSDTYSTEELVKKFSAASNVKYAEPNYIVKATDVGTDTYKDFQWALENDGQNGGYAGLDINADDLFDYEGDGEERVVAVVDSGVDYTHEDLEDAMWINPYQSKQLKGKYGYDFVNSDEDPLDDAGHGSHCAGIIAATANNATGIAGVANNSNIKIMALKFLDHEGYGDDMGAIGAYNYIYKAQQLGVNVVAVNNSWGGAGSSEILEMLIDIVGMNGAISVCAAGNEMSDNDETEVIPANIYSPYVISVAAANEKDELATFSNYGASSVDIAAPGTNILSSVSYNCFNPTIYDNTDELCDFVYDFESGKLVKTIEDDTFTDTVVEEGDISYGITTYGGEAEITTEIVDDVYFGKEGKSLQINLKGAKKGEIYYISFPYTVQNSGKSLYSSATAMARGPEGNWVYNNFYGMQMYECSMMYICDGPLSDKGVYNELFETAFSGDVSIDNNYWVHGSGNVGNVKAGDKRALTVQLYIGVDGDHTINIDDVAVAKTNVDDDLFGKYDFYNGTSMATPQVAGAVAAAAYAYPEETAAEIKARIIGSVRKSEELEDKIISGGVLDLSLIDNPVMSVETTYIDNDGVTLLSGCWLDGAKVYIDGNEIEVLEQNANMIIFDGSDYINKVVEITIVKGGDVLTLESFLMAGQNFECGNSFGGMLDGGSVTSSGNSIYYVDKYGYVCKGTPNIVEEMKSLDWEELYGGFSGELFGEAYLYSVNEKIVEETDVIYANKSLWTFATIDVGFSEETAFLTFDEESCMWNNVGMLPEELFTVEGYNIATYNDEIFLFGGYDSLNQKYSTKVFKYDEKNGEWIEDSELPEGRVYAKGIQVEDKLVVTLGGNAENNSGKNMIYDGEAWTVSETELGKVVNPIKYTFEDETVVEVASGQIGVVEDGILYTDICVDGLGDTFIYSLSTDNYESTGYVMDRDSYDYDYIYATTVQNDMYMLGGYGEYEDDYELFMAIKSALSSEEEMDEEELEEYLDEYLDEYMREHFGEYFEEYLESLLGGDESWWTSFIDVYTMPIETGYVNIADESQDGVYVEGAGYYNPGESVTLTACAEEDYFVKGMTVNGEDVKKKSGKYSYKFTVGQENVVVSAQAGAYVTAINIKETQELQPGESVQMMPEVLPEYADNKNVQWSSENSEIVEVSPDGTITASADAVPGTKIMIYAFSEDRQYPLGECKVVIVEEEEITTEKVTTNEETTTGEEEVTTIEVTTTETETTAKVEENTTAETITTVKAEETTTANIEETTKAQEESNLPKVNSKVVVGKNVYKIVTSSKKSKTVTFVSVKNKNAKKATIPATIKLNGATYKVTGIAANAFKNCKKLNKVVIGNNVTTIGKNAFQNCKKLIKITIKSSKIKKVKKSAFTKVNRKLVITTPKKSVRKYKKILKNAGFKGTVK